MIYPDFFPCPSWNYNQQTTEHLRRTQFTNGWTRQRKRFAERNNTINLEFVCSTKVFAAWGEWFQNNGYDWFQMTLAQGPVTVRAISPVNYSYKVYDTIYAVVTVEEYVEATGTTVPTPIPPQTSRPPIPGTEIYCLEYECDAYATYMQGNGEYYWPADNPKSDGYLAGTPFNIDITTQQGFSTGHKIMPGSCDDSDSWKSNTGAQSAILDATDMMPFEYRPVLTYSMVYRNGGGSGDLYLGEFRFLWKTDNPGASNLVIFKPFVVGENMYCAVAGNQPTTGIEALGVISNPQTESHVLTWQMELPTETVAEADSAAVPVTVILYVDYIEVARSTINLEFYNGVGDAVYYPAPKEEAGGGAANMWLIHSTDNFFAHLALNGYASIDDIDYDAAKLAWEQNKEGFEDPDENCLPRPTSTMGQPIPETVITEL